MRPIASTMFSSDSRRMPLSTPETHETTAMPTPTAIRAACTARFSGTPNRDFSP